ncbi:hypothetical protein, partial [Phytomonospora endophytica]
DAQNSESFGTESFGTESVDSQEGQSVGDPSADAADEEAAEAAQASEVTTASVPEQASLESSFPGEFSTMADLPLSGPAPVSTEFNVEEQPTVPMDGLPAATVLDFGEFTVPEQVAPPADPTALAPWGPTVDDIAAYGTIVAGMPPVSEDPTWDPAATVPGLTPWDPAAPQVVDPQAIPTGVTWTDYAKALADKVPAGEAVEYSVGVAGWTLGGGWGKNAKGEWDFYVTGTIGAGIGAKATAEQRNFRETGLTVELNASAMIGGAKANAGFTFDGESIKGQGKLSAGGYSLGMQGTLSPSFNNIGLTAGKSTSFGSEAMAYAAGRASLSWSDVRAWGGAIGDFYANQGRHPEGAPEPQPAIPW